MVNIENHPMRRLWELENEYNKECLKIEFDLVADFFKKIGLRLIPSKKAKGKKVKKIWRGVHTEEVVIILFDDNTFCLFQLVNGGQENINECDELKIDHVADFGFEGKYKSQYKSLHKKYKKKTREVAKYIIQKFLINSEIHKFIKR